MVAQVDVGARVHAKDREAAATAVAVLALANDGLALVEDLLLGVAQLERRAAAADTASRLPW